eukprot:GILJ01003764.1.p1 GENE.GILJ01003764.1~~GILJ01003764.1.p1  ORF type:complete len:573 (-),score=79.28 GILJ01003764.1:183-1901(-)
MALPLPLNKVVGVLGGGQLGRMMNYAARRLGVRMRVLDPTPDCPAGQCVDEHILGGFDDPKKIEALATGCDVVTIEIEHVNVSALELLESRGVNVQPSSSTVAIIQDKFKQKQHFSSHGVALGSFKQVDSVQDIIEAGREWGYPVMLKAKRNAYDGKGNCVVRTEQDVETAFKQLGSANLYVERWVDFVCELAVMVARTADNNQLVCFPVVQTIHRNNICHITFTPPAFSCDSVTLKRAEEVAKKAIASLTGAGVFGVEMFLLSNGDVLLNEIAPRPHNSGHYSIEGCATDQYEQHLRAILNMPLGDSSLIVGACGMMNILGLGDGDSGLEATLKTVNTALIMPGTRVHWYGKSGCKIGRKLGHITVSASDINELVVKMRMLEEQSGCEFATEQLQMFKARPQVGIVMGSDSDLPHMKEAAEMLDLFAIPYELSVVSAHRTPERMYEYAQHAHERGIKIIIAGAGGSAHLPGMIAALTPLPVIGVPVITRSLSGVDSLLSIVQMPRGIPVATVAINNSANAGLLAVRMLSIGDGRILQKVLDYSDKLKHEVEHKAEQLEEWGWQRYLAEKNL